MEKLSLEYVNRIFQRLEEIYKEAWTETHKNQILKDSHIVMWQSALAGVTVDEIKKALELCEKSDRTFPPHAIEFWQYAKGHTRPRIRPPNNDELFHKRSPEIALEHLEAIKIRLKGNVSHRTNLCK